MKNKLITLIFFLLAFAQLNAQSDPVEFDKQLTELAKTQPGLLEKVWPRPGQAAPAQP